MKTQASRHCYLDIERAGGVFKSCPSLVKWCGGLEEIIGRPVLHDGLLNPQIQQVSAE